jgi:hypothetical protein
MGARRSRRVIRVCDRQGFARELAKRGMQKRASACVVCDRVHDVLIMHARCGVAMESIKQEYTKPFADPRRPYAKPVRTRVCDACRL